ncbi:MAG TPA: hypothetical protein VMF61_12840 [Candidatus Acidoferrales bacterium]|nr:hypothetical protein [Candidatus Acidoferrales bacterium]
MKRIVVIAGLFGHRHLVESVPSAWYHAARVWATSHWAVLAVVIPVAGGLAVGFVNHCLALARENRARKLNLRDVRARVHADLAARLLAHCTRLHQQAWSGSIDGAGWRAANEALYARAQRHDVVDALGRSYVSFMAAIESERRAIGREDPRSSAQAYVPFIEAFGERRQARRLQRLLNERTPARR